MAVVTVRVIGAVEIGAVGVAVVAIEAASHGAEVGGAHEVQAVQVRLNCQIDVVGKTKGIEIRPLKACVVRVVGRFGNQAAKLAGAGVAFALPRPLPGAGDVGMVRGLPAIDGCLPVVVKARAAGGEKAEEAEEN